MKKRRDDENACGSDEMCLSHNSQGDQTGSSDRPAYTDVVIQLRASKIAKNAYRTAGSQVGFF